MDTNSTPATGQTFTLRQLLAGDVTLIIPDMQRDYCWGSDRLSAEQPYEKVSGFVAGLVHLFNQQLPVTMGLLYGYEETEGSQRLLIIDGQQRLTTLYLLLGMLYRRTPEPWLRQLLISDYELIDDREPRLLYQMRTEALYFMSDLVACFFLDRNGRLSQLERSAWYFASYDDDPTVQSFIGAIRSIDQVLERASQQSGWDFRAFATFVADELLFMYYDLGSRSRAERMFITINTTGQPLTPTQNLKSMLYGAMSDPDDFIVKWEEMEQWCWMHRRAVAPGDCPSGDGEMQRLFDLWRKYYELTAGDNGDEHGNTAFLPSHFDDIYLFFKAYSTLVAEVREALDYDVSNPDDMMVLLPSIEYVKRWGGGAKRMWHYLRNILRYQRASASGSDALGAIKVVQRMRQADVVSLLSLRGVADRIVNAESRSSLQVIAQHIGKRDAVERLIDRAQSHPLLNGRVQRLISWCTQRSTNVVDISLLRRYVDAIYELWGTEINHRTDLDLLRRAMLTLRHRDFPILRRSATSLSLCWNEYDWQRLMSSSPGVIRQVLDCMLQSPSASACLHQMISRFTDRQYPYYFLIKNADLLAQCGHRSLMQPCDKFVGYHLQGCESATRWFVEQLPLKLDADRWHTIRSYGALCVYTDHRFQNIALDIYHTPNQRTAYRFELFCRPDGERVDLRPLLDLLNVDFQFDKKVKRFYININTARSVVQLFNDIMQLKF